MRINLKLRLRNWDVSSRWDALANVICKEKNGAFVETEKVHFDDREETCEKIKSEFCKLKMRSRAPELIEPYLTKPYLTQYFSDSPSEEEFIKFFNKSSFIWSDYVLFNETHYKSESQNSFIRNWFWNPIVSSDLRQAFELPFCMT